MTTKPIKASQQELSTEKSLSENVVTLIQLLEGIPAEKQKSYIDSLSKADIKNEQVKDIHALIRVLYQTYNLLQYKKNDTLTMKFLEIYPIDFNNEMRLSPNRKN